MQAQTSSHTVRQPTRYETCDCPRPIPEERAERRGTARTYCARCDRPLPLRWPRR